MVRVDRKVSLELLNDVAFLLEAHVLQADETTTPLRQLYFVLQTMLMDPQQRGRGARAVRDVCTRRPCVAFANEVVVSGLNTRRRALSTAGRIFDAMRDDPRPLRDRGSDPCPRAEAASREPQRAA